MAVFTFVPRRTASTAARVVRPWLCFGQSDDGGDRSPDPYASHDGRFVGERELLMATSDGGGLHVRTRGQGQPVLFLHGWGANLDTWGFVAHALASHDVQLIAIDQRGHGGSSAIPKGADLDLLVDDVVTVIESLDLREVVLVGHSLGGVVAQRLVTGRPETARDRLRGIVLVNTTARGAAHDLRTRTMARVLNSPFFADLATSRLLRAAIVRQSFPSSVASNRLKAARRTVAASDPAGRRHFELHRVNDVLDELGTVALPVTVLAGSADPIIPIAEPVTLANAIDHSRIRILLGGGHLLPIERPDEVAAEVCRHLTAPLPEPVAPGRRRRG
jgi:pimeloyl-ACP methyl ester carboxylesterase